MCAHTCVSYIKTHGPAVSVSSQACVQGFGSILGHLKIDLWKVSLETHSCGCWQCPVVCGLLEKELDFLLARNCRIPLISYHGGFTYDTYNIHIIFYIYV